GAAASPAPAAEDVSARLLRGREEGILAGDSVAELVALLEPESLALLAAHPVLLAVRTELVAHLRQRLDRLGPHRLVHLVRAELGPLEETGEAPERGARRAQKAQGALQVLERRLGRIARDSRRLEQALHPRVRRDDRRAGIL